MSSSSSLKYIFLIGTLSSSIDRTKAEVREAIDMTTFQALEKSVVEKEKFIRRIVHELRTPLHLTASLIQELRSSVDKERCLNNVENQTSHLRDIVEDLVFIMRQELGINIYIISTTTSSA